MIRIFAALCLALAAQVQPAAAQELWSHQQSGISLPRTIGDMTLREERDISGGGNFDVALQYGDTATPVTLYVYRSAYPNAALWFERTRLAMNEHVGSGNREAAPRSFTLGGASAPNGLREEIELEGNRSTAVALAQIGQWMMKVRITSTRLNRAEVGEAMDRILAAARFANTPAAPHPLVVPGPCGDEMRMTGARIANVEGEPHAGAAVFGIIAYANARGAQGLAAEPDQWCRVTGSQLPVRFGSLYRRRDGAGWVALVGDSGRAIAAVPFDVPGEARAAVYASTPTSTQAVAVYRAMPDPDEGIVTAIPVVTGQARGIAEIGTNAPGQEPQRKNQHRRSR